MLTDKAGNQIYGSEHLYARALELSCLIESPVIVTETTKFNSLNFEKEYVITIPHHNFNTTGFDDLLDLVHLLIKAIETWESPKIEDRILVLKNSNPTKE